MSKDPIIHKPVFSLFSHRKRRPKELLEKGYDQLHLNNSDKDFPKKLLWL